MTKLYKYIFTYLFPIIMLDYYLILRGLNLNSFIVLPIFFLLTVLALKLAHRYRGDLFVAGMNIFLFYSLFTVVFYAFNDAPFDCYTTTLRSFVFPIIFAYLGYGYSKDHEFNKWYLYGCAFCFLVGFYLYLNAPSYYVAYMAEVRENAFNARSDVNETNILEYTRFSSFFATSYAISCFSIPALILSLSFSLKSDKATTKLLFFVIAFASFIAAILCQQRIAMAFAIIVVIFWLLYSRRVSNVKSTFVVVLSYVLAVILSVYLLGMITNYEWFGRVSFLVDTRFEEMNFAQAMGVRSKQYDTFDRMTDFSFLFGLGLGSCGHAAVSAGLKAVADGEFIKMFYELGLIGVIMFSIVVIPTLFRGIKYFKYYYVEVVIIIFYLAAGIASNSITFFIFSIMFWYSLGRIWNKSYFDLLQQERLSKTIK